MATKSLAYYNLGVEYEHLGEYELAIDAYSRGFVVSKKYFGFSS
jgi:tetratricopeptide (TPR) repeat protein